MKMKAEEYARAHGDRVRAFQQIAKALGEDHAITKMMGPLAWGRHDFEGGPSEYGRLQHECAAFAFLEGYFAALNRWARDHAPAAQRTMLSIWPSSYR